MVTRAYVTSKVYMDNNGAMKCKIYVPIFGESMEYDILRDKNQKGLEAIIACSPNENPQYKPGDAVIVAFEEYVADSPIIIGWLYGSTDKRGTMDVYSTFPDVVFNKAIVGDTLITPKKIYYNSAPVHIKDGGINHAATPFTEEIDLGNLRGLNDVVQVQIDNHKKEIQLLKDELKNSNDRITDLIKILENVGIITNGYYSAANYEAVANSEPVGALPPSNVQDSKYVPGN